MNLRWDCRMDSDLFVGIFVDCENAKNRAITASTGFYPRSTLTPKAQQKRSVTSMLLLFVFSSPGAFSTAKRSILRWIKLFHSRPVSVWQTDHFYVDLPTTSTLSTIDFVNEDCRKGMKQEHKIESAEQDRRTDGIIWRHNMPAVCNKVLEETNDDAWDSSSLFSTKDETYW